MRPHDKNDEEVVANVHTAVMMTGSGNHGPFRAPPARRFPAVIRKRTTMRAAKIVFVTLVVALVGIGLVPNVLAFHSGGVAECGGCHSMHSANQAGSFLLIGQEQSSTCLTCPEHAGL